MPAAEALKELLESERAQGFFTAYYAECGRLDEAAPVFRHSNVPGSKLFDLASLTKALSTGPLVHQFLRSDTFHCKRFKEEFQNIPIAELLSHRSGLPAWWNFWIQHLNEGKAPDAQLANSLIPKVFARISLGDKKDLYSDLGYILLGFLLERETAKSQAELFQNLAQSPDIGYAPLLNKIKDDFIPSAFCKVRNRLLQGEVHDENCAALGGIAGHAGLFGTGPALAKFLKDLYHSPSGRAYLEKNAAQMPLHSFEGLLGLRRGNGTSAAPFHEGQGMGHLGFVGTAFWMHLPSREYVIFLSNRVISGRVSPRITELRKKVIGYLDELLA